MSFAVDLESGKAWYGDPEYEWLDRPGGDGYWAPVLSEEERALGEALERALRQ